MGNQNTSGTIEEEVGMNDGKDNAQGVIETPNSATVENQMFVQENAAEGEGDKIPHVERLACDDKDIEDHEGSVEGSGAVIDMSMNGSDSGEGMSKLSDEEEQDQPSSFIEDLQQQNPSPKCTTVEAVNTTPDIEEEEEENNVFMKETLEADDQEAKKNEDDLASLEGAFSEAREHEEELGRDEEPPQEEQSNSFKTINDAPSISLLDSSPAEKDRKNESFPLDQEEKPMVHGLENVDVDQDQPSNQEFNHFLIRCSTDTTEVIKGDDLLEDAEKHEDINEATDQSVLEKALHCESEPSALESETITTEKCVLELQSSKEITPPISEDGEPKASDDVNKLDAEAYPSYLGSQIELRKSPSFDFGISFDTRSVDSDQTPLLYQDKTARRSLSSCSNLRFQITNVQKEYAVKPLQFEGVQVEEKTILMGRSKSKSPPSLVMSTINNNQENGSSASPSRDDDAAASLPKGNGRRKARSSLFTTCICCTAAIS